MGVNRIYGLLSRSPRRREGARCRREMSRATEFASQAALLDLVPDAIFARDASRRITFWSRGAEATYGHSSAQAVGTLPGELLHTSYPMPIEEIERTVALNGSWHGDLVQQTSDGRRLVVESRWAAEYDDTGHLSALLEVNRDVTTRLRPLTALLEMSPDALVGVGGDGGIVLVNGRTEGLFGYTREELVGRPVETLIPGRFRGNHGKNRDEYFADPTTRAMGVGLELFARHKDGHEFPAEVSLSTTDTDAGLIAVAAIRDISKRVVEAHERERLQTDAERERLQNQLHQSQRLEALGQLAGGIAHDFNNLLAVIINYADFVADDVDAAARVEEDDRWTSTRDDVEQIRVAAQRASQLIRQLLAFARREVVQPEVVDVNDVVLDVEKLLRRTLGEHIELHSSLAENLRCVLIDPGQLEQILMNLAVNARDAMPDGGTLRIDTANLDVDSGYASARPGLTQGAYMRLRVSDTGSGMSPETVRRAFDPFYTTKPAGEGTGLGLATVYGIIQQAGGRSQIYSEPDVGTTITFVLPATEETSSPRAASGSSPVLATGGTILLVEDEHALREVTRRILARAGYTVIPSSGGLEAIAAASTHEGNIDLLLSDVIMPRMAGPQLARKLSEIRPGTAVLMMSGFAQPILDSRGHLDEGVTLIEKPFSGPELLASVARAIANNTD